ncbi:hypothetical protein ACFCZR_24335 [Streptomyces rubiginosohelvolus]|uniref:hypothetical protein n=1 Tax=Streptomyces rubiginosohelvolus TaxID=67362 RepID=UPI0035DE5177
MSPAPLTPVDSAARSLATALARSADHLAEKLTCFELEELLDLFAAVGDTEAVVAWIQHHEGEPECEGHTAPDAPAPAAPAPAAPEKPLFAASGEYTPEPGTEYPFSVSDIARAVSAILGDAWMAESGYWGTTGSLSGPFIASFTFTVDHDGDLLMSFDRMVADGWPEGPTLPEDFYDGAEGVHLTTASASDGLEHLAEQYAAAVRAITGF